MVREASMPQAKVRHLKLREPGYLEDVLLVCQECITAFRSPNLGATWTWANKNWYALSAHSGHLANKRLLDVYPGKAMSSILSLTS